jgi:hypothetical protein
MQYIAEKKVRTKSPPEPPLMADVTPVAASLRAPDDHVCALYATPNTLLLSTGSENQPPSDQEGRYLSYCEYCYTQRRDIGNSYECFVGLIVNKDEIFIKEAGSHCTRFKDITVHSMRLHKRGEGGSIKLFVINHKK